MAEKRDKLFARRLSKGRKSISHCQPIYQNAPFYCRRPIALLSYTGSDTEKKDQSVFKLIRL
jgi:hypothetical protein